VQSDGSQVARVYATPVNYKAANGEWQPVDDTLVRGEGGWHAAASAFPVSLPSSLASGGVSLGQGPSSVSFALQQASGGEGQANGSELTYPNVQPGVSVSYSASSSGILETLSLASSAAPAVYTYKLGYAAGLRPTVTAAGGIAFVDSSGKPVYTMAPPTAADSSPGAQLPSTTPVHYQLSGDGTTLSLLIDTAWLHDPSRVYPVKLDPDVYFSEQEDCTIASAHYETTNLCGGPLYVGANSENPKSVARAMLRFNLASIPRDSAIVKSRLALWFKADTTSSPVEIEANALTRNFTQAATWKTYDGTNTWSAAGGDFSATTSGTQAVLDE
jgi:hypothetical protein